MRDGYKRNRVLRSGSEGRSSGFNSCLSYLDEADVGGTRSTNIADTGEDDSSNLRDTGVEDSSNIRDSREEDSDYYQDENEPPPPNYLGRGDGDSSETSNNLPRTYEPRASILGKRNTQVWETPITKKPRSSDSSLKKGGSDKAVERMSVLEAVDMVKTKAARLSTYDDEYSHFGAFVGHVLRGFNKDVARSKYQQIMEILFATSADDKQDQPPHPQQWSPDPDEIEVLEEDKESD
ncbi:unnamed protein product [Cylicostephanus goldi]|uniref:Uncharacterized protein n=1 Tax=Cylicostephanus goldi TaxID=71465 RepID=A0A3P6RP96_CYLGO|nr:unnamed protein product [Cylicostephanus goldi]